MDFAYHPRIPTQVRAIVSQWGTCKDEYEGEDGWSSQLIFESQANDQRLCNDQRNCEKLELAEDAIGLAAYEWILIMFSVMLMSTVMLK